MEAVLEASPRASRGKNEARRLRASGLMPAVVYGGSEAGGEAIAVDPKELWKILHSDTGANTLITLRTGGGSDVRVMVREYQLDPISSWLLHADFYRVAMDRKIEVTVPVIIRGEARGVKQQGGVLEQVQREVEIECLPADIPEHFDVDVSELVVGQAIRVRDVLTDPRWTAVSDLEMMLVHIIMPKIEEEAPAAEAAAAPAAPAEPEVIKKGKVEKPEEEE
jgi:large subunit ribosomal protein L25